MRKKRIAHKKLFLLNNVFMEVVFNVALGSLPLGSALLRKKKRVLRNHESKLQNLYHSLYFSVFHSIHIKQRGSTTKQNGNTIVDKTLFVVMPPT